MAETRSARRANYLGVLYSSRHPEHPPPHERADHSPYLPSTRPPAVGLGRTPPPWHLRPPRPRRPAQTQSPWRAPATSPPGRRRRQQRESSPGACPRGCPQPTGTTWPSAGAARGRRAPPAGTRRWRQSTCRPPTGGGKRRGGRARAGRTTAPGEQPGESKNPRPYNMRRAHGGDATEAQRVAGSQSRPTQTIQKPAKDYPHAYLLFEARNELGGIRERLSTCAQQANAHRRENNPSSTSDAVQTGAVAPSTVPTERHRLP